MKKSILTILTLFVLLLSLNANGQTIQLRSVNRAECTKSDMTSLRASFSFSSIDAENVNTKGGDFSWISMPNTVIGGNEGDPQIPVINELIAIPVGAQPTITVTSFSSTDYKLSDLGIKTIVPRQPSLRKDKKPEDVPFVYNASSYQVRGMRSAPQASVSVEGTMRGVRLGKMTIEPVSYDPVSNTIRVFNDIEVEVSFNGANAKATEDLLVETYSPYFDVVYKSLFNGRAVMDAYSDHPDLYITPVKMLVVTTSTFTSSTAFQNWLTWKKQKGIDVDVYTVTSSTSSSTIRSGIQSRYNTNHPSFLVIVGDETVVPYYSLWDYGSTYGNAATDLEYASVDGDIYHDMYLSRMPVANTTQLGYLVDKILMYEKYTMSDPSYLNNVLLIAGWDSNWTNIAGKPTINYAANNYFTTANGFSNVYKYITTGSNQTTCYNYINNVGFVNYTAHGDIQEWSDPNFTNSNVNSLTNTGKPFWAMGNCCLTANFKNAQNSQTCYGETMVRAQNKAAFGYIGSVVESYWYEDLYFGVGAFSAQYSSNNNPTVSGTSKGAYDALFDDAEFNCLNSVPYIGNVAVTYAYSKNYSNSSSSGCSVEYYWRCYQCFGDGSVMPYLKVPAANNVSHAIALQIGATSFTVNADAGSYVSITVNNEIIGVAAVPANATSVDVPITAQTSAGTAMIVVTRNQRQPYITTIPIESSTQYTISVQANPTAGGTVSGANTYYNNESCTLTATANHGYAFTNWTLNGNVVSTNPTYTFTVTANGTYTANFRALTQHHMTYTPQQEHGTISVSPANAYAGDIVTLTATPEDGYRLNEWIVETVSKERIQVVNNQFTMPDSDVTISASFRQGYEVTIASLIGGTITASVGAAQPGETITLTVTPNTGYSFVEWNVYETGNSTNTVTVTNNSFTMPAYDVTVSAVFGVATQVQVETVDEIGTGTSTNQNIPTTNRARYSLTEQIYTASELGAAGTITGIEFYYTGNTARTRTLQIYMVSTTKTSFSSTTDWIKPTSSNMVYSGSVSFAARSWTTITFSTPFTYDGTNNVALIVDDNTGSTNTSAMSFYVYTPASSNQAMYINGTTNYNPTSITTAASGRLANKNRINVHITRTGTEIQPLVCDGPTNVNASNVTPESAVISWEGTNDSYNLRYREFSDDAFVYGFEDATAWTITDFSPCTVYDGDNTATYEIQSLDFDNEGYTGSFIAFQNGLASNWAAHSGDMFGACLAANGATNNDWFILPARTIEAGDIFSFWARSITDSYGLERIKVGVYRGSGSFSSYLEGSASTYTEVPVDWTNYSYDLSSFAGQNIQLAINCVSDDALALLIDDISITNPGGSWDVAVTDVTSPYTITGLNEETVYEYQVIGVCDGIGESAGVGSSFSTLSWCSNPTPSGATNIAASSADLNWTGFQDSYNVQYRTAGGRETLLYEEFEDALPSDWATSGLGSSTGVNSGYFAFFRNGTTPQYLITPELNITESGCYYYISHVSYNTTTTIQIGYSSTTNATSAFTWGTSQTVSSGTSLDDYYEEIPTGTKYVALRVNSVASSSYYYLVDFVAVLGPYVEPGTWVPANNVTSGHQITGLTPETRYEWQVQGNCTNGTTGWSTSAYFWTPSLCDTPDGLTTTNITHNSATLNWPQSLESYNLHYGIPETKFFYDFEDATPWAVDNFSPCTTYDGDGSATGAIQDVTFDNQGYTGSFIAFQNGVATGLNAHGGDAFGACFYATTPANNDFFILPSIEIESGDVFSFWALGYASNYPESFKVGVYNGNGGLSSYLAGSASESITPTTKWQQYSYDLTAYAGQTIQLAINCVSSDAFIFAIDDIFVGNPHWGETITCQGGSYNLTGLTPGTEYGWQVQGRNCSGTNNTDWSGTATFTTPFGKEITGFGTGSGKWYFIASPLAAETAPTTVTNMLSNTYDLFYFDQSQANQWVTYKAGNGAVNPGFNLVPGKGYLYANSNDVTLLFSGAAYNGNGEVSLAYDANALQAVRGWNLVGNPFTENAIIADGRSFYVMNADGTEMVAPNRDYVEPMEGVFVHAADANDNTITFSTATSGAKQFIALDVTRNRGTLVDRAIVSLNNDSQLPKFMLNANHTKIYVPQNGEDYAVVSAEAQGEMPVNFKAAENGEYTISANLENVEMDYLYLVDTKTGTNVDLMANPSYTFNATTSDDETRFRLVFGAKATGDYELVTAAETDWSGEYVIAYVESSTSARVLSGKASGNNNYGTSITATIDNNVLAASNVASYKVTIEKLTYNNSTVYTIKQGSNYLGLTSTTNGRLYFATSLPTSNTYSYYWTISYSDNTLKIFNVRYNTKEIQWNSASNGLRFACYASTQKAISLFKKIESNCAKPEGLTVDETSITTNAATATWTAGDATRWNLRYKNADASTWTTVNGLTTATYTFSGLTAATEYDFEVQTDCGDEQSEWVSESFMTECDVTSLPFFCGFETTAQIACLNGSNWADNTGLSTSSYHAGSYCFMFQGSGSWQYLIFPEFDGTQAIALSFYYRLRSSSYSHYFKLGYATESDLSDLTFYYQETATSQSYQEYTTTFPKGTRYVVLACGASSGTYYTLYVDDFNFTDAGCIVPTDIAVNDITRNSALITWEQGNHETQWQISLNGDDSHPVLVNTNSYSWTGLTPDTRYTFKVRSYCDASSQSDWSDVHSFTTEATCPAPKNLEVTDLMATSATLNWTSEAGQYNVAYAKVLGEVAVFEDGFENGLDANGWTVYTEKESPNTDGWYVSDFSSNWTNHGGSASVGSFSWSSSAYHADNYLVTPLINDVQGTLKFWVYSNYADEYEVLLSLNGNSVTDFNIALQEMTPAPSTWTEVVIDLNQFAGHSGYIAIHHQFYDGNVILVDDFAIYATSYGTWTETTTTENSLTINGLDPETNYGWKVQANCGDEDGMSSWSSGLFTTPDMCSSSPVKLEAETAQNSATLTWEGFSDSYNVRYREGEPVATIILTTGDVWSDGSGYQMLIDADAMAVANNTISDYSIFEYKIPANADYDENTSNVVFNTSVSIQIPAGTYDWFITNPSPDDKVYIAGSNGNVGGRQHNYVFEGGKTYEFVPFLMSDDSGDGVDVTITDAGAAWTTVNDVTTPCTLSHLTSGTGYEFQVQGNDCDGNGGTTNWSHSAFFRMPYSLDITGYTSNSDGWNLIASPLAGEVSPADVNNMLTNTYDLFYFDQSADKEWVNYKEGDGSSNAGFNLVPGKGYLYANSSDVTLLFTGTPYNGGTIDLVYDEDAQDNVKGWNLVGNSNLTEATVDRDYYYMSSSSALIAASHNGTVVAPMQGIFVKATETNETVTFIPADNTGNKSAVELNLVHNSSLIDRVIVSFNGNELPKFQAFKNNSKLYVPQIDDDYAIVSAEAQGEMPVNFKAAANGQYTISANVENVTMGYLHLIDTKTGDDIDLMANPSYTFNATSADSDARFRLVFKATGLDEMYTGDNFAFISNGEIILSGVEDGAILQVVDMLGRTIGTYSANSRISTETLTAGVYVLQLVEGSSVRNQKIVVK